jgi:hypothetical protein
MGNESNDPRNLVITVATPVGPWINAVATFLSNDGFVPEETSLAKAGRASNPNLGLSRGAKVGPQATEVDNLEGPTLCMLVKGRI